MSDSILNSLQARQTKSGPQKPARKAMGGYVQSFEAGRAVAETIAEKLVAKYGQARVKLIGPNTEGEHIGVGVKTKMESTNVQVWASGRIYITDVNVLSRLGLDVTTLEGVVWEAAEDATDEDAAE